VALAMSALLACGCGSGGGGGPVTGTKFGAVLVEAPGLDSDTSIYFASAVFGDSPRLLPSGESTSLAFGVGEPDGCTKSTVSGCQVYRCSKPIVATPVQFVEPNVGAIAISWSPASGPGGGDALPSPITLGPVACYSLFWQTATPVTRFGFSAAGGTIPAFPDTDVDVPHLIDITELNGIPLGPPPPPTIQRAAGLRVTWTGGTAEVVFVLRQSQVSAVCRAAASAGSFTFPSSLLGELQPGDAMFDASVVSSKVVAAGDYATTLAVAGPVPWHFPFTLE
jgi:hypothetical protein